MINVLIGAGALLIGLYIGARWGAGRLPGLRKEMVEGTYHSLGSIKIPGRPGWVWGRSTPARDTWLVVTVNQAGKLRIQHWPIELRAGQSSLAIDRPASRKTAARA
ncbi:MAG: hypothetical protein V4480_04935 [Patescibacteria group bacterium]